MAAVESRDNLLLRLDQVSSDREVMVGLLPLVVAAAVAAHL